MIKSTDRISVALAGLVFALAVLYLVVPRLAATFLALNGDAIANELATGEMPAAADLRKLVVNRTDVLNRDRDPRYARDLSRAYHNLIEKVEWANQGSIVQAVRDASLTELTMRPLNAVAWWRLGVMENNRAGRPTRKSAMYLWRSLQVQANAPGMTTTRLRSILDNWLQFDAAERRVLGDHVADIWREHRHRRDLLKIVERSRRQATMRAALLNHFDMLGQFEAELVKAQKRKAQKKN